MPKRLSDETPTGSVVWAAAEQIGKTGNREELERICDYLVNKNWFQAAGDLRAARQVVGDWQALEVPARLKIAIQQVLDENIAECQSASFFRLQADEHAPLQPTTVDGQAECEQQGLQEQWWGQTEGETDASYPVQSYASDHYYYYDPATASYVEWPSEGNEAAVESSYDQGNEPTSVEGAGGCSDCGAEDAGVVQAEAVEVEEGEIATGPQEKWTAEQQPSSTWTCGQCTFANAVSEAFCEMCMGHVSLSLDAMSLGLGGDPAGEDSSSPAIAVDQSASTPSPCVEEDGGGGGASGSPAAGAPAAALRSEHVAPPPPVPVVIQPPPMMQFAGGGGFAAPMSPAYAPSAPDFDQEDACGSSRPAGLDVERCEEGTDGVRVDRKSTPADFLALAFQRKTPISSVETATRAGKTSAARREETAEYV